MKLDENYSIETDVNNFTLKFYSESDEINEKTGKKIISKSEWYYGKLSQALDKYANEKLKIPNNIQELRDEIKELFEMINRK